MLIIERIKNIARVTQHGCSIIKQMAHNGVMTWVIMPDALKYSAEKNNSYHQLQKYTEHQEPDCWLI